jgi:hypothetical protein
MKQCLRCGKPCETTFCAECRSLLHDQLKRGEGGFADPSSYATVPLVAVSSAHEEGAILNAESPERMTVSSSVTGDPETPLPPVNNQVEEALHNLHDAAQRIAEVETDQRRKPRASRLSPFRDISGEIQRESTPHPHISDPRKGKSRRKKARKGSHEDYNTLPDLWPWLSDSLAGVDGEDKENDSWDGGVDPLLARRFPDMAEIARIEEEDIRRARIENAITAVHPATLIKRIKSFEWTNSRVRIAFFCLAVIALLVLIIDSAIVSFAFLQTKHDGARKTVSRLNEPPSLTLSNNVVNYGQTITVFIRNFSPSTRVYLTRDIDEPVLTNGSTTMLQVGEDGSAKTTIDIESSWGPGFHTLQAEDIKTRYTVSTTLRVAEGPTRPSQLSISTSELDLGAGIQGANTLQPLMLRNSGHGPISWAASSNRSWLLLTPSQGTFSDKQTIMVAGQRANLKPGDYTGVLVFTSDVSEPITVKVTMTVRPLPPNVGAVLAITPAALSYMAVDGEADPAVQALTISNPGTQPLYWSVANNTSAASNRNTFLSTVGPGIKWLNAERETGVVAPGKSDSVRIVVHSRSLLPGTYIGTLIFSAGSGYSAQNSPQTVSISLTVQQRCSLVLNAGSWSLAFTAVEGQGAPNNQTLNFSTRAGCSGTLDWHATTSVKWLTITPASGWLKKDSNATITLSVDVTGLKPGIYPGSISLVAAQSTRSIAVQLTYQPKPLPNAPIISAAPLTLNFSTNQGQDDLPGQVVTITNTGRSPLMWRSTVNMLGGAWITASPVGGTIAAGQTGQVTINLHPGLLTPGNYTAQVLLNGTDTNSVTAGGSPQTITINLIVSTPCTLSGLSSSALSFSAKVGDPDPAPQSITISASGDCRWPLHWTASGVASWLSLSASGGTFSASSQSATLTVLPKLSGLDAKTYTDEITINALDSANEPVGSKTLAVSLVVQDPPKPCSLALSPGTLSFSSSKTSASLNLATSGTCANPLTWQASADSNWIKVDASGTGVGDGVVNVSVNSAGLDPGLYNGTITVSATDSNGDPVTMNQKTVSVQLEVPAPPDYTVSGTVNACDDGACSNPRPLSGATVTLNGGGQTKTSTTDGSGRFSFGQIPAGNYTLSVNGSDGGTSYSGSKSISVSGDQQVTLDALASSTPTVVVTPGG